MLTHQKCVIYMFVCMNHEMIMKKQLVTLYGIKNVLTLGTVVEVCHLA